MSYTLIYDRCVVKTPNGRLTMCLLSGDNNVWELGNKRRSRSWYTPRQLIATTEEKILDFFSPNIEGFMWNGRMLSGDQIPRFAKKAIKNAKTVEEIYNATGRSMLCYIRCEEPNLPLWTSLWTYIKTTEGFLKWLEEAEAYAAKNGSCDFMIGFEVDKPLGIPAVHPPVIGKTLVMIGRKYVLDRAGKVWLTNNVKAATVFESQEAAERYCTEKIPHTPVTFHSYDKFMDAYNKKCFLTTHVVVLMKPGCMKEYVTRLGKKTWKTTYNIELAKRYTPEDAKQIAQKWCGKEYVAYAASVADEKRGDRK